MKRTFEPGFPQTIEQSVAMSPELSDVLLDPSRVLPDIQTVASLSDDIARGTEKRIGVAAKHTISQVHRLSGEEDGTIRRRFGDAVVDEVFITDLINESKRKPILANTDHEGVLRGLVFELDRDTETSLKNTWENVGLNYHTIYVGAIRPGRSEEEAISLMAGTDPVLSAHLSPWILKLGFADAETTRSIKQTLQLKSENLSIDDASDDNQIPSSENTSGVFRSGKEYRKFIELIRNRDAILRQPYGVTLINYLDFAEPFCDETFFVSSAGDFESPYGSLLITEASSMDEYDGELLVKTPEKRLQSRLVAGRFIVQSAVSFLRDSQWVRVEEIDPDAVGYVHMIVESERAKTIEYNRLSSAL
jgi:hypothetical protein